MSSRVRGDRLEVDVRYAISIMEPNDHQEIIRGTLAGTLPFPARYHVRLSMYISFHSCNYGIFTGWCLYGSWDLHKQVP